MNTWPASKWCCHVDLRACHLSFVHDIRITLWSQLDLISWFNPSSFFSAPWRFMPRPRTGGQRALNDHGWSTHSGMDKSRRRQHEDIFLNTMVHKETDDQRQQPGQWQQCTTHYEAWTIQDWQHQGYQRVLTRQESFAIHNASAEPPDTMQTTATSIQVEELGATCSSLTPSTSA